MLAGVALIEAGVRVLLLLLGVMPVRNGYNWLCSQESYFWLPTSRGKEEQGRKIVQASKWKTSLLLRG